MSDPDDKAWACEPEIAVHSRRISRRSFLIAAAGGAAALAGWQWVRTRPDEDGIPWPLRRVLGLNERIASQLRASAILSKEFPKSAARMPRQNGVIGLDDNG